MRLRIPIAAALICVSQFLAAQDLHIAGRDGLYGYVDHTGTWVIEPRFIDPGSFVDGVARVFVPEKGYAFIDERGRYVMPPKRFERLDELSEGLAAFELEQEHRDKYNSYGYLNAKGQIVIPEQFYAAYEFSEGLAAAAPELRKCGFIDHSGKFVIAPLFELNSYGDCGSFHEGLAHVIQAVKNGKAGFIDHSGKFVIPPIYEQAFDFSEGYAVVRLKDDSYGFIDKHGIALSNLRFGFAHAFSEGLAAVNVGGKWGYIDNKGVLAIPAKYDDAGEFWEDRAWVELDGKRGYIDRSGVLVIPAIYDETFDFWHGMAGVLQDYDRRWNWTMIDKTGNPIALHDRWPGK